MAQDRLTMTFLFCRPYDIIIWAGQLCEFAYFLFRYLGFARRVVDQILNLLVFIITALRTVQ